jgi:sugar O-acyltransferase (sialic acid O-acetyltransferase NeuD family)
VSAAGEPHAQGGPRELFLAGAGSFALEVADWAAAAGMRVAGLIDLHDGDLVGSEIGGVPVISPDSPGEGRGVAIAAGGDRGAHWELIGAQGWRPCSIVHPRASIAASAELGGGVVAGPGAIVGAQSKIGAHALLSRGVLVGHHVNVERFVSLLPGANVASHTRIGLAATLGMGAIVIDHTLVGAAAVVAAGAVVVAAVESGTRVQGVPARVFTR